jgi:asparagine synthase (glutamine-hydrolysing)
VKLRRLTTKLILREVAKPLLPERILKRPKQGFGLPIDRWMREDLAEMSRDVLLDRTARDRGIFEPAAIEALLERHQRGEPRGDQIWALMMLELWYRTFIDR